MSSVLAVDNAIESMESGILLAKFDIKSAFHLFHRLPPTSYEVMQAFIYCDRCSQFSTQIRQWLGGYGLKDLWNSKHFKILVQAMLHFYCHLDGLT